MMWPPKMEPSGVGDLTTMLAPVPPPRDRQPFVNRDNRRCYSSGQEGHITWNCPARDVSMTSAGPTDRSGAEGPSWTLGDGHSDQPGRTTVITHDIVTGPGKIASGHNAGQACGPKEAWSSPIVMVPKPDRSLMTSAS
ncbi:unnamed protein product [Merluccius merluccius]